jgi:hypothetical protein
MYTHAVHVYSTYTYIQTQKSTQKGKGIETNFGFRSHKYVMMRLILNESPASSALLLLAKYGGLVESKQLSVETVVSSPRKSTKYPEVELHYYLLCHRDW